jgi:hypothetical protein
VVSLPRDGKLYGPEKQERVADAMAPREAPRQWRWRYAPRCCSPASPTPSRTRREQLAAAVQLALFQPTVAYTTKTATTCTLSSEGTYDWLAYGLSMPLIGTISQVTKINGQLVSLGVAVKYYVAAVPSGPHGVGGRFTVTLLFPGR